MGEQESLTSRAQRDKARLTFRRKLSVRNACCGEERRGKGSLAPVGAAGAVEVVDGDEGGKVLEYSRHDNRGHGSGVSFVHGEGRRSSVQRALDCRFWALNASRRQE